MDKNGICRECQHVLGWHWTQVHPYLTAYKLQTYPRSYISPTMLRSLDINVSAGRSQLKDWNPRTQKWQPISQLICPHKPYVSWDDDWGVSVEDNIHYLHWKRKCTKKPTLPFVHSELQRSRSEIRGINNQSTTIPSSCWLPDMCLKEKGERATAVTR